MNAAAPAGSRVVTVVEQPTSIRHLPPQESSTVSDSAHLISQQSQQRVFQPPADSLHGSSSVIHDVPSPTVVYAHQPGTSESHRDLHHVDVLKSPKGEVHDSSSVIHDVPSPTVVYTHQPVTDVHRRDVHDADSRHNLKAAAPAGSRVVTVVEQPTSVRHIPLIDSSSASESASQHSVHHVDTASAADTVNGTSSSSRVLSQAMVNAHQQGVDERQGTIEHGATDSSHLIYPRTGYGLFRIRELVYRMLLFTTHFSKPC
jgi:hypothetical protein